MNRFIAIALLILVASPARAAEPEVKAEDLPRTKPVEPADAVKSFKVRPGFHIELVAAEPLVVDPICMSFDENGRLFVVEMIDYSERRAEKLSRIRILEDTDGDGKFDKSTIFLDHLPWATAVMCVNGGVLVGACPDIIFARDTNGDGKADEVKTVFTGFGSDEKLNVQGLFNNFIWGLDNRIHGCSGHDGGMVVRADQNRGTALDVKDKGFVIDPRNWTMTTEAGGGQYGLSYDQYGQLFTCTNSSHCETFMYDAAYGARNPNVTLPDPRISIAADGPAAEVFRISPEEPWRVIRTRWRIAGLVGGPVEGGGRSAGYFTGATGITIYRGNAFPPEYVGDAFVGDAGGNLVHHKRIKRNGIDLVAERPADEQKSEFCASTDTWFRPVDFANAPDGTLYIADMYREVIEHPWSIPPNIKKFLDLNSGNDRGRIYRLVPDGFKEPPLPKLGSASIYELVATLDHTNGWHRDTAARLLFEKQDKSAVPLLKKLFATATPIGKIYALHSLEGLASLDDETLQGALGDPDEHVRAHAIKLAERSESPAIQSKLLSLANDESQIVRYQLAFSLGELKDPKRVDALATILRRDIDNTWIQSAVLSSLVSGAGQFFAAIQSDPKVSGHPFNAQLVELIGASGNGQDLEQVEKAIAANPDPTTRFTLAAGLADGLSRHDRPLPEALSPIVQQAVELVKSQSPDRKALIAAVALLGHADASVAMPPLLSALTTRGAESVQSAALNALAQLKSDKASTAIISSWSALSPRLRIEAASILLKRDEGTRLLLKSIQEKSVSQSDLSVSQVAMLLNHRNPDIKAVAQKVLVAPAAQREAAIEAMKPALSLKGDLERGHAIYAARCVSCHRAGNEGHAVGPDLVTVRNGGPEKILTNILDPNREVAPNYIAYMVDTKDGENVLGIVTSDTPASITLREAYGKETSIPRDKIKKISSQRKSLMPEGLEVGLKPQDFADLLEFVQHFPTGK